METYNFWIQGFDFFHELKYIPASRILIFTNSNALPTHYRCFWAHLLGSWKSLALNLCIWMVTDFPSPKNIHLNGDGFSVNKKAGEGGLRRDSTANWCGPAHVWLACPSVDSGTSCHTDLCELLCNTRIIILALFPFYIDFCAKCLKCISTFFYVLLEVIHFHLSWIQLLRWDIHCTMYIHI